MKKAQKYAAAASAQVQDPVAVAGLLHDLFDQVLCVLLRDQHAVVHFKSEPHKIAASNNIGERFAEAPSDEKLSVALHFFAGHDALRVQEQSLQVCTAHIFKKEPRIQLRLPLLFHNAGQDPCSLLAEFSINRISRGFIPKHAASSCQATPVSGLTPVSEPASVSGQMPNSCERYVLQSNTASTDAMPTSIISSSGSLVVISCIQSPGLEISWITGLLLVPARRMIS